LSIYVIVVYVVLRIKLGRYAWRRQRVKEAVFMAYWTSLLFLISKKSYKTFIHILYNENGE